MALIKIAPDLWIDESELKFSFTRSSGPGGQNVNKVSTAVQLSFDVNKSNYLTHEIKKRLKFIAGNQMAKSGILILKSEKYRTQSGNKNEVINKFKKLLVISSVVPVKRKKTKPSKASDLKRLKKKKLISDKKKNRSKIFKTE